MTEMIALKCRCGAHQTAVGAVVDLAEFLRRAICDGWRRIDEEPLKAVQDEETIEIVLTGVCARCDRRQASLFDRVFRRPAPTNFQKAS